MLGIFNFVKVTGGIIIFTFFIIFRLLPSLDLFNNSLPCFIFAVPILYRLLIRLELLADGILNYLSNCLNLYRVFNFVNTGMQGIEKQEQPAKYYTKPEFDFTKNIILKNVTLTLGYKPILKKVSLKIKANSIVCILGFDGVGRSAVFDLISGIRERDFKANSEINVFGVRVEDINSDETRASMHIIDKNPVLFEGSIRQNIDPYD